MSGIQRNRFNSSCPKCEADLVIETAYFPRGSASPEERSAWIMRQNCSCKLSEWESSREFTEMAFDR